MKELLLLLVLLFSACSNGPEPDTLNLNEDFKCSKDGVSAPEWVCGNVESEDIQVAIGMSQYSKIGKGFNLSEATANGVMKIEKESQFYIRAKVQMFARMMDPELGTIADSAMEDIAKEISRAEKNDYKQIKEWQNPTNSDLYVLIAIQNKWLDSKIKTYLLSLYKADASVYKKFLALDGEDKLDDLFE